MPKKNHKIFFKKQKFVYCYNPPFAFERFKIADVKIVAAEEPSEYFVMEMGIARQMWRTLNGQKNLVFLLTNVLHNAQTPPNSTALNLHIKELVVLVYCFVISK